MHTLHRPSLYLLNLGELREGVVTPMGCISVPGSYVIQTPTFGVVSNTGRKKKQALSLVLRQHSFIKSSLSATRMDNNMVVKEDSEFNSSFGEYLGAMESGNREKKKPNRGSDHGKMRNDAAFSKDASRHQKHGEAVKYKWIKNSDSKVEDKRSVRSAEVADRKRMDGSVQTRNSVRSDKEIGYIGSKNGLSKKRDVHTAAANTAELGKKKTMPVREMSDGAAINEDGLWHQKHGEAVKYKWVKNSDSKVEDKRSVRSAEVADRKRMGGSVQTRNSVRSEKEMSYAASKNGLSKKHDVHIASAKTAELGKKKFMAVSDMSVDDAAFNEDGLWHQKHGEAVKYKWVKNSDSKVEDKRSVRSAEVADRKRMGGSVQTRNSVRSEKEMSYAASKNGLSKKHDVHIASAKTAELGKKKFMAVSDMSVDDAAFNEDGLWHQKHGEAVKYKWVKNSDSRVEDKRSVRSAEVADRKRMGVSVQTRNNVRSEKEMSYVGSRNVLSKKHDVHTAAAKTAELGKKKIMPVSEMSVDDDLEMDRFIFQPSELSNDGLDVPRVSQMEMEERIQKLALSLNNADLSMPEWMFAKTMRSARIRFSDHSMLRIIQILGKFRNWRRVLQVVEWLQMNERYKSHKTRYVYTAALDALGKAKRPVEALNLFYSMQRHKTTYPDIVTYHSIAVTLGQAGHMKELFDVIDNMRSMPKNFKIDDIYDWDPRLEPDIVVYNAVSAQGAEVLNGCVKRKESEGAVWVLQKLEETGQQPSSTTYGLAMEVMLACGKYDLVHEYFKLVQRFSVPNALTYRVVVNTLWREGKPDEAIAAVQEMENRGLIGSASLYYDLGRCLCSVGRCEEGLMQVGKICKVASKPLMVTYTGLIQACLAGGHIHDAASIFKHMKKHCSPNTVTCNVMLKAYLGYGLFDEAKELFQKMTHSGHEGIKAKSMIRPDVHTFNTMLKACTQEKRWADFNYAYEQMLQHGHPFNTKKHLWMVLQASGAGKVETIEITWSHLVHTERVPPPALIKERFRLKMENNNLVEAVSSVARHPSTHQQSFSKESWLQFLKDNAKCFKKEALEHLIQEVSKSLSMNDSSNVIYQNLLDSCTEFVRHDILVTGRT